MRLGPGLERRDWGQRPQGPTTQGQWVGGHQERCSTKHGPQHTVDSGQLEACKLAARTWKVARPMGGRAQARPLPRRAGLEPARGNAGAPAPKPDAGGSGSGVGRPSTVYVQCYSDEAGWVERAPPRETYIGQGSRTETEKVYTRAGASSCPRRRKLESRTDSDEGGHNTAAEFRNPGFRRTAQGTCHTGRGKGQSAVRASKPQRAVGNPGGGRRARATARGSESHCHCGKMGASLLSQSVSQSSQSVSQGRTGIAEPAGPAGTFPSQNPLLTSFPNHHIGSGQLAPFRLNQDPTMLSWTS